MRTSNQASRERALLVGRRKASALDRSFAAGGLHFETLLPLSVAYFRTLELGGLGCVSRGVMRARVYIMCTRAVECHHERCNVE